METLTIVSGVISVVAGAVLSEEYRRWRDKGGSLRHPVVGLLITLGAGFLLGLVLHGIGVGLLPTIVIGGFMGWLLGRWKRARGGPGA